MKPRTQKILRAYKAGESVTSIAERLSVTPQAVCFSANKYGLFRQRKLCARKQKEIARLRGRGLSPEEIGKRLGLNPRSVSYWAYEMSTRINKTRMKFNDSP